MAYCTNSDVTNEFRRLTLNDSTVSTAKVDAWISQEDAYIDGKVGLKYVVPITATEALKIIKKISILLVSARVKDALDMGEDADPKIEIIEKGNPRKKAEAMLQDIIDGKLLLSGASLATSADGVKSFNASNSIEHVMDKSKRQW